MVLWIFLLFFLICLIFVLYSIKYHIQGLADSQRIMFSQKEKAFEKSDTSDLQKNVALTNLTLKNIDNFYKNKFYLADILKDISSNLLPGMYLDNLSLTFSEDDKGKSFKAVFSGFVPTRELLFEFKKNFEKQDSFKNIAFPTANWAKPNNIDFSVSFETDKKQSQ